jgi:hypothetical protein
VTAESASQGPSSVIGYFTNARTVTQCHTSHTRETTSITCNGPVANLKSGQVLVILTANHLIPSGMSLKTNTVVDGQPVMLGRMEDVQQGCPAGTASGQALTALLTRPTAGPIRPRWELVVTACVGDSEAGIAGTGARSREVVTLLRSLTFPKTVRG